MTRSKEHNQKIAASVRAKCQERSAQVARAMKALEILLSLGMGHLL